MEKRPEFIWEVSWFDKAEKTREAQDAITEYERIIGAKMPARLFRVVLFGNDQRPLSTLRHPVALFRFGADKTAEEGFTTKLESLELFISVPNRVELDGLWEFLMLKPFEPKEAYPVIAELISQREYLVELGRDTELDMAYCCFRRHELMREEIRSRALTKEGRQWIKSRMALAHREMGLGKVKPTS